MINRLSLVLLISIGFASCVGYKKSPGISSPVSVTELHYIGQYVVPHNLLFKQTTVGGLSGIDYDRKKNLYYIISDDWSAINPARFYTARIPVNEKGIDSVQFLDVLPFRQKNGAVYPSAKQNPRITPDPEALRYNPVKKNFIWTNEGERYINKDSIVLQDPSIRIINRSGQLIDTFPLPFQIHAYATEQGIRRNGVFEGLTFANRFKNIYVSVEEPLFEDGPSAGLGDSTAFVRLLKYNTGNKQLEAQYAYQVDPVVRKPNPANGHKINGIVDVLAIDKTRLLFVERSYSAGRSDCNIRVYTGDVNGATNVASYASLKDAPFKPITKQLLLNMDSLGIETYNIEGVTIGPKLSNGHYTLIFVVDSNFKATEKMQFLLFEIIP